MQSSRMSSIIRNLQDGAAVVCIAAMTLAVPFNASAHVLPGSVLSKYKGFINAMTRINPDGSSGMSCCHEQDGQGGLEEQQIKDSNNKVIGYRVKIVNDEEGVPLENPIWVEIPQEAILQHKQAIAFCRKLKETDPTNPDVETCKVPPTNALWTSHIPHNAKSAQDFQIYCYLHKPETQ